MPTSISSTERLAIYHVLESRQDIFLPMPDDAAVHSRVLQINRWRQQNKDTRPELDFIRVCKRFDPPRILLEYRTEVDMQITDKDGTPIGITLRQMAEQAQADAIQSRKQEAEQQVAGMTEVEKRAALRPLAESLGMTVDEMIAAREEIYGNETPKATSPIQNAIQREEARIGRPLTESEKAHIRNSLSDDGKIDGDLFGDGGEGGLF